MFSELIEKKNKLYSSFRKELDKHPIIKFLIVASLLISYLFFAAKTYGLKEGVWIGFLTWSFFVLCTPVSDAGVIIDFPVEFVTGIRMVYSEMIVWTIAISLNTFTYLKVPQIYEQTVLLSLFKHIIEEPFPYWAIILLSCIGTFLSLYVADSFLHKNKKIKKHVNFLIKHKLIIFGIILLLDIAVYDFLLNKLGVSIPWI